MGLQTVAVETIPDWWLIFDHASGLWTVVAAFVGFLGGTVVNYGFTVKRDNRLREADRRALAAALHGELEVMKKIYEGAVAETEKTGVRMSDLFAIDATVSVVPDVTYRSVTTQLGLLGRGLSCDISNIYAMHQMIPRRIEFTRNRIENVDDDKASALVDKIALRQKLAGRAAVDVKRIIEGMIGPELENVLEKLADVEGGASKRHWWQRKQ